MRFEGHPYRGKSREPEQPPAEDWHSALRGPSQRHSLRMGVATLTCTLGYPAIVQVLFDPQGPGAHEGSVTGFVVGGIAVTVYFLFAAIVSWAHRWSFIVTRGRGWKASLRDAGE